MEAELILKMLECIEAIKLKLERAKEAEKRDVDNTHCRIQFDTMSQWTRTLLAMEEFVAPYKTWALEWEARYKRN